MKKILSFCCVAAALFLAGCADRDDRRYVAAYQQALASFPGATEVDPAAVDTFLAVFTGLTSDDLPARVAAAYAPELYFSDTLHVLHSRDALADYLHKTGERLDDITVTVLSVNQDGEDVYVRWQMQTQFSVMGKDIDALSIGISHLRFNNQGQVILHQDYWDSTEGLFSHLPFVGGVVRWARGKT